MCVYVSEKLAKEQVSIQPFKIYLMLIILFLSTSTLCFYPGPYASVILLTHVRKLEFHYFLSLGSFFTSLLTDPFYFLRFYRYSINIEIQHLESHKWKHVRFGIEDLGLGYFIQ